jgi:hypothetical protein
MDQMCRTLALAAVRGSEEFVATGSGDASKNALAHNDRQGLAGDSLTRPHRGMSPADPARMRA